MKTITVRRIIKGQPEDRIGDRWSNPKGARWQVTRVDAVQEVRGAFCGWWVWVAEFTPISVVEDLEAA